MTRQRLYNPAHLTPDELKEAFVARQDSLAEMLRLTSEQTPGRPCQHMMLIGPRGMGKTTLGLRFLYAVEDSPELRDHWQPVAFHEESYGIVTLADFWIHALRHLTRTTGEGRWEERADSLEQNESDMKRLAAYALDALIDFNEESGKRLILFVENIDAVLGQIRDEREIHMLRATLIERPEILLLGSANAFFEAISGYGQPLYEFFRILKLVGIGQEDARRILKATADREGLPDVPEALNREHGRLETIRRLTGGNPRLLVLACRMLIESPLGSAMEDLERLIDEQTPYFKARIEELPVQARKVFHCLSEGWKPLSAKEVAVAAKLSSSHASAQLKQLLERGYVREVELQGAKRMRYEVSDRFYNVYYVLRFSGTSRARLERLVAFLHDLYGPAPMRAVRLNPHNSDALDTLSDVLACGGRWTEALERLDQALDSGAKELHAEAGSRLAASLMRAAASGHGKQVKRMMEASGLAEPMEPLWHAVRAELGEGLEPLPAEVMDAVKEVRRQMSKTDGTVPDEGCPE